MGTELPDRKGNRLKGYDYSARGVYFVTICTQNRVCNLGSVVGADASIGPYNQIRRFSAKGTTLLLVLSLLVYIKNYTSSKKKIDSRRR